MKMRKRILAIALSFCMVLNLMPQAAFAADHVHDDTCGYEAPVACGHTTHDDTCGYAEAVTGADCTHTHGDCSYAEAVEGAACTHEHYGCGYEAAVPATPCTHVCSAETGCTEDNCVHDFTYHDGYCGYFEGSPESPCEHSHDGTCGYVEAVAGVDCNHQHDTAACGFVEAVEGQTCMHEGNVHDDTCGYFEGSDCNYVPPAAHEHTYETNYNDTYHWDECSCGDKGDEIEHSYSAATCAAPATCSCGATTGSVDSTNHTGGTEVRNAASATATQSGYTGDTYCLGCDTILVTGSAIPATGGGSSYDDDDNDYTPPIATDTKQNEDGISTQITAEDGSVFEVGFIPGDGVTLPDDAELVVREHYPSLAPIASTVVPTAETEYVDIPENNISRLEDIVDGYKLGEIIVINGEKYMVCGGLYDYVKLIRLSDEAIFEYDTQQSDLYTNSITYDVEIQTNRTIVINGTKYDVPATMDYLGIERYVLYVDGVQAGLYFPSGNEADFVEGYDPETLKAQQDDNDLGSVTIPADYNNAAIADFAPGKTYKVSVIGSNDISVEGLTEVNGTVTQTFDIPAKFVGNKNVKYVAVHDTNPYADDLAFWEHEMKGSPGDEIIQLYYEDAKARYDAWEKENGSGAEFGTITLSLDGLTLTATHTGVRGFSPFIVYAFVEADEPEYKELSATLHTEHTGGEDTPALPADNKKTLAYIVKRGDTLWALSRRYGCTVAGIVAANSGLIKDPDLILVGWELLIPQD